MSQSDPSVWVLTSDAIGGDGQSIAIAEALGWPFHRKRIHFKTRMRGLSQYRGRFFRPCLAGVDLYKSDELGGPWPDLVIAAGRRQVPVERWIKWKNGGNTRLVHIQRPIAPVSYFDLVICEGYGRRENVIDVHFPLMRKAASPDPRYLERWRERFSQMPRPWHMLLVGGPAAPFRMSAEDGSRMVREIAANAAERGGSVFVTTSRRTPPDVTAAMRDAACPNVQLFEWQAGVSDNPYVAMLTLADAAIVTADSVSMMVETARLGVPVWIYPLPERSRSRKSKLARLLYRSRYMDGEDWKTHLGDKLRLAGLIDLPDNLKVFHQKFISARCGGFFGSAPVDFQRPPDEMAAIVNRIRGWFDSSNTSK